MTARTDRRGARRGLVPALLVAGLCQACSAPEPPPAAPSTGEGATRVATGAAADTSPATPDASDASPVAPSTPSTPSTPSASAEPDPAPATRAPSPEPPPAIAPAPAPTPIDPAALPAVDEAPTSIVVTMLSRGKGVPEATRAAYREIRTVLERGRAGANATALHTSRIGLEGETRLCADFDNRDDARTALAEVRKLAAGVDLLDVAEAPCPPSKEYRP